MLKSTGNHLRFKNLKASYIYLVVRESKMGRWSSIFAQSKTMGFNYFRIVKEHGTENTGRLS